MLVGIEINLVLEVDFHIESIYRWVSLAYLPSFQWFTCTILIAQAEQPIIIFLVWDDFVIAS